MTQLQFRARAARSSPRGPEPRLCTTSARVAESKRVQLCKHHTPKPATVQSRPRVLGETKGGGNIAPLRDKQCTREVHYYLRSMFEDAKKLQEFKSQKLNQQRTILSVSRTAPTTPVSGAPKPVPRVTFSAFGLPTRHRHQSRHGSPRPPQAPPATPAPHWALPRLEADHGGAGRSSPGQRVFIRLSRPSCVTESSSHWQERRRDVKKQTYRPFCLLREHQAQQEQRLQRGGRILAAPPSSPTRSRSVRVG